MVAQLRERVAVAMALAGLEMIEQPDGALLVKDGTRRVQIIFQELPHENEYQKVMNAKDSSRSWQ